MVDRKHGGSEITPFRANKDSEGLFAGLSATEGT
jgi:hypothetical protein